MTARKDLPSVATMADHIVATYRGASDQDVAEGAEWYAVARQLADGLAADFGLTRELSAGVIAVLSPGVEWSENARLARAACETWQVTGDADAVTDLAADASGRGVGNGLRRAVRLLASGSTADVERTSRTLKVHSFWRSILGETDLPCVDSHATRVALGTIEVSDYATGPSTDAAYRELADAYRKAAAEVGETPRDLQAITWVACKRRRDALRAQWRRETGAL